MKKSNRYFYIASIIILLGILLFTIFKYQNLKQRLTDSIEQQNALEASVEKQANLSDVDSLINQGSYKAALDKLKEMSHDSSFQAQQSRTILINRLLQNKRRLKAMLMDSSENQQDSTIVKIVESSSATRAEIDSIQYLLDKANYQIESLKKQIRQRSYGEYLEFKSSKGSKIFYVGNVKNGKANGKGIALFETGSRYEGEWQDNKRHGKGSFYWPDGEYYIGQFRDDEKSGAGTYYWPNGEKYTGEWSDDERNGKGAFYNKEGEVIAQGIWKNDELVKKK